MTAFLQSPMATMGRVCKLTLALNRHSLVSTRVTLLNGWLSIS